MCPQISVIIPVYNASRFLSCCVESVLEQTFSDFELLLIDDGSTDGSDIVCDKYAEKDRRIRVFHKTNGGVCSARNLGLDNAEGEFVVFMDADDYVDKSHLEHLMRDDSDMALTGVRLFQGKDEERIPRAYASFRIEELPSYWNTPPQMNYLYCYPWAKRYRRSIIQDEYIRFNESLFFSEDMCFNMQYMSYACTFTEYPFADYMYRMEDISRDAKFKMSANQLITHYEYLDSCFHQLYSRIRPNSLSFVRDNTNLRLMRKFVFYLLQVNSASDFIRNIYAFRDKEWGNYMLSLLKGKKERRVMKEAILFPLFTYWIEVRFYRFFHRFCKS